MAIEYHSSDTAINNILSKYSAALNTGAVSFIGLEILPLV